VGAASTHAATQPLFIGARSNSGKWGKVCLQNGWG